MTQDEYDDLMTEERQERKGRFASGPEDDPRPAKTCDRCGTTRGVVAGLCDNCTEPQDVGQDDEQD